MDDDEEEKKHPSCENLLQYPQRFSWRKPCPALGDSRREISK